MSLGLLTLSFLQHLYFPTCTSLHYFNSFIGSFQYQYIQNICRNVWFCYTIKIGSFKNCHNDGNKKNLFFTEVFLNKFGLRICSCKSHNLTTISLDRTRRLNIKQMLRGSRSQMFFKIGVLSNFAWGLKAWNFIKKRLQQRTFPFKFEKFL